ncbi:YkvA family protein [Rubrivirga sp. IMCC45206]|uniref:YkvA family protein n=1 Tax=Rubrivirga sp. IMCC45206 TaxID=3391614 RepID=UPI00398FEA52
MTARLRAAARRLKLEVDALAIARRDPRVPRAARVVIGLTVAYALSPVDLIPDVIPILGLLDDVVIVPLGLWLALRMVPPEVMAEARVEADRRPPGTLGLSRVGLALVIAGWALAVVLTWAAWRRWGPDT